LKLRRSSEPHCYILSSHTVYTPPSTSPVLVAAPAPTTAAFPPVSVSLPASFPSSTAASTSSSLTSSPASISVSSSPFQHSRYFSLPLELLPQLTAEEEDEDGRWSERKEDGGGRSGERQLR
jgi:hypothetical protein